jgi:hypothetical protein
LGALATGAAFFAGAAFLGAAAGFFTGFAGAAFFLTGGAGFLIGAGFFAGAAFFGAAAGFLTGAAFFAGALDGFLAGVGLDAGLAAGFLAGAFFGEDFTGAGLTVFLGAVLVLVFLAAMERDALNWWL